MTIDPFDNGILDDEEFNRQVADGRLVKFRESPEVVRADVLAWLRARVRGWKKPPLKQDLPR